MNWPTLPDQDQRDLLETLAKGQGQEAVILEKDLWVVWTLQQGFATPRLGVPLAFRGGTSLSKGYAAITHFSEDLDLTLGLLGASGRTIRALADLSRGARERAITGLGREAQVTVQEQILPHLQSVAQTLDPRPQIAALGEPADLQLALHYPSVLPAGTASIPRRILLEFGGSNRTEPREQRTIRTYLAEDTRLRDALTLPEATVDVLDARRTFWEKLTAVQVACAQPQKLHRLSTFSRHLLDLHLLMPGEIGPTALADPELRDDVLATTAVIVPAGEVRRALEQDDVKMEASGMVGPHHVPFTAILTTLEEVQRHLERDAQGTGAGQAL